MRRIVLGILGLFALFSCQKEDERIYTSTDYVQFSTPMLGVETMGRSSFIDGTLPENSSFGVLGYCVPYQRGSETDWDWGSGSVLWNVKRSNVHADVFYKQEVVFDGTACAYAYGNTGEPRKWYNIADNPDAVNPEEYSYTFFAYYPYGDGNGFSVEPTTAEAKGAPILTFTMPFNSTILTEPLNDERTPDAMIARVANVQKGNGNVSFTFNHVLTGLGFWVRNYNQEHPITLTSVKLRGNFTKSVIVDFTGDEMTYRYAGTYSGEYTLFAGEQEVEATNGEIALLDNKHILLISGTPTENIYLGTDVKVLVEYVYDGANKTATLERPGNFMPRAGTKYTGQINFVGDAFVLNFVAEEQWEDGGDSDITIQ